jgi:hypothetical protein
MTSLATTGKRAPTLRALGLARMDLMLHMGSPSLYTYDNAQAYRAGWLANTDATNLKTKQGISFHP